MRHSFSYIIKQFISDHLKIWAIGTNDARFAPVASAKATGMLFFLVIAIISVGKPILWLTYDFKQPMDRYSLAFS